jgi:hypothetical protein
MSTHSNEKVAQTILRSLFVFSLLIWNISVTFAADEFVVPILVRNIEANSVNGIPYHLTAVSSVPSMRYQQSFRAGVLGGVTGIIDKISYRPDKDFGFAFIESGIDIEIRLSHIPNTLLLTTFADNIGTDETVVLDTDSLTLSSSFTGPVDGPKDFDIVIDLDNVFKYNGVDGLLLDVRLFNAPTTTWFDAQGASPDTRRVHSQTFDADVNSLTGVNAGNPLVTKFTFQEPGRHHIVHGVSQFNYVNVDLGPSVTFKLMNPSKFEQFAAILLYEADRDPNPGTAEVYEGCLVEKLTPHASVGIPVGDVRDALGLAQDGSEDIALYAEVIWAPTKRVTVGGSKVRLADGLGGHVDTVGSSGEQHAYLAHPGLFSLPSNSVVSGQKAAAKSCICSELGGLSGAPNTFGPFGIRC